MPVSLATICEQRRRLGLRAEPEHVTALLAAGTPDHPMFGVPLTAEETAHFAAQPQRAEALAALEALFEPIWGGGWLGSFSGPALGIALTREPTHAERVAMAAIAEDVEVTRVPATLGEMRRITRAVTESAWWAEHRLVHVGPSIHTGTVEVGVRPPVPRELEAQLRAEFGPLIRVFPRSRAIAV